jgi:hypothetical protein
MNPVNSSLANSVLRDPKFKIELNQSNKFAHLDGAGNHSLKHPKQVLSLNAKEAPGKQECKSQDLKDIPHMSQGNSIPPLDQMGAPSLERSLQPSFELDPNVNPNANAELTSFVARILENIESQNQRSNEYHAIMYKNLQNNVYVNQPSDNEQEAGIQDVNDVEIDRALNYDESIYAEYESSNRQGNYHEDANDKNSRIYESLAPGENRELRNFDMLGYGLN